MEALAALLLVAIVAPVMISAVGTTSQMAAVARDRTLAVGLAETRMNETILDQSWQFGDAVGTFEDSDVDPNDLRDWRWEITVTDWLDASVKEMTVRVIWTRRGRDHDIELSTLVSGGGA